MDPAFCRRLRAELLASFDLPRGFVEIDALRAFT
jgi:hypothetical protein